MFKAISESEFRQGSLVHGCVIMASGRGTRFGGNKLMAELAGKPLVEHVVDAVDGLFDTCVVVTRYENVAALCKDRNVQIVLHDEPRRNDTVRLGMEALGASGQPDTVTFFQGDQPLIGRESIKQLLRAAEDDAESIWRTSHDDVPGSPVLFPAWTFPELVSLPEGKGGGFVAKKHPERVHTVQVRDALELFDVDTQDDLRYLESAIQQLRP